MPRWNRWQLQKLEQRGLAKAAADYVLSVENVADMLDVDHQTVRNWTTRGRRGWMLPCERQTGHPHAKRMFRIWDVMKFAERCNMHINWEALPPELVRLWANQHSFTMHEQAERGHS